MEIFHLTAQKLQRGYQKPKDRQPNHYSNYFSGVNLQFSQGINKLLGRSISLPSSSSSSDILQIMAFK